MRIIKDNFNKKEVSIPKIHTCRWCKSIFDYNKEDTTRGNLFLSEREDYINIKGLICPACNKFDNLNNGY